MNKKCRIFLWVCLNSVFLSGCALGNRDTNDFCTCSKLSEKAEFTLAKTDAEYLDLRQWLKSQSWTPSLVTYAPSGWNISSKNEFSLMVTPNIVVWNDYTGIVSKQLTCKPDEKIFEILAQIEKSKGAASAAKSSFLFQ